MLRGMIHLHVRHFLKHVYFNVIVVALLSSIIPLIVNQNLSEGFVSFVLVSTISLACTLVVELFIGCPKEERLFVFNQVRKYINKKK